MGLTIFYVPFPNRESAEKSVRNLLQNKLIACANILVSESHFIWKEELTKYDEFIAIMKTSDQQADLVRTAILSMHPYETPAVIDWKAGCNEGFETWLRSGINGDAL